jgi:hypothetical protein
MILRTLCLAGIMLLAATASGLSAETGNILEFERGKLKDSCQQIEFMPGFIDMIDLNGDGLEDAIIDYSHLQCDGSNIAFCGTGGCTLRFYAGLRGDRYAEAGEFLSHGIRTSGRGKNLRIAIRVGGGDCGKANAASCTLDAALIGNKIVVRGRRSSR